MTCRARSSSPGGCACRGCRGGALGDTAAPTVKAIGAPAGVDPVVYLRAHLNRYTAAGGAPIQYQIAIDVLPLIGTLDATTATRALWVLDRRAGAAAQTFNDPASNALLSTYGKAWGNPIGYVQGNLPAVIDVVRLFGDANHLPAAQGVPSMLGSSGITTTQAIVIGGGVLAAYFLLFKKRRR